MACMLTDSLLIHSQVDAEGLAICDVAVLPLQAEEMRRCWEDVLWLWFCAALENSKTQPQLWWTERAEERPWGAAGHLLQHALLGKVTAVTPARARGLPCPVLNTKPH